MAYCTWEPDGAIYRCPACEEQSNDPGLRRFCRRRQRGEPPKPRVPCLHRGAELRRIRCGQCVSRVIAIYACTLHGECSIHAPGSKRDFAGPCCLSCDERLPPAG